MNEPIRIAAALIEDGTGRILLVRKTGTHAFMQPGGKIEAYETPWQALTRELAEEIGFVVDAPPNPIGRFSAEAANEPGRIVDAHLFRIRTDQEPRPAAEIAEALWVEAIHATDLLLAPLTRRHVLPIVLKTAA